MSERRVYVVQQQMRTIEGRRVPKLDLSQAESYGRLVYLLGPEAKPDSDSARKLRVGLQDYDPSTDYLLPTGNPTLIGWTTAIAAHVGRGEVTILQWEGAEQRYVVMWQPLFSCQH